MKNRPLVPLVKGGQGRSDAELAESANRPIETVVMCVLVLVWALYR